MIRVVQGELADATTEAVIREARSDGSSISPAGRRLEQRLGVEHERLLLLDDAPPGSAFLTPAGRLDVAYLIHIVVQSVEEPVTEASVERGLTNALRRAAAFGVRSITLPALGIGAGNLEAERSAQLLTGILARHLEQGEPPTEFVVVVPSEYEEEIFSRRVAESLSLR